MPEPAGGSARAVLLLSLAAFASAAALRASDLLLPLIAASFGTTPGGASAVITGFAARLRPPAARHRPDRRPHRQVPHGVLGDRGVGGGQSALRAPPSLPLLVAARFATGATVGAIVPLAMAWFGDAVRYERRQTVLARFLIGHMLGLALATSAAGFLGERYGWQSMDYALSVLYALTALLLFAELHRNPLTREARAPTGGLVDAFRRMAALARRPWVRVILAVVFRRPSRRRRDPSRGLDRPRHPPAPGRRRPRRGGPGGVREKRR